MAEHDGEDHDRLPQVAPLEKRVVQSENVLLLLLLVPVQLLTGLDEHAAYDQANQDLPIHRTAVVMCLPHHADGCRQHHSARHRVGHGQRALAYGVHVDEGKGQGSQAGRDARETAVQEDAEGVVGKPLQALHANYDCAGTDPQPGDANDEPAQESRPRRGVSGARGAGQRSGRGRRPARGQLALRVRRCGCLGLVPAALADPRASLAEAQC
mmetsp:Transcript_13661/g.42695  ORF Transcript_13661/g.42695 Transcript_13661/m.42695 type:complete len:212 (+) Transcript_13661:640-1275(+)